MKRIVSTKIFWLLLLLIAIIFASISFGTFEGLEMPSSTMPPMDSLTEEQRKMLAAMQMNQSV